MPILTDVQMPDGGPHYSETNFSNFIVEPYNTITAFLFLVIGLYWFVRLSDQVKTHTFLFWMSAVLLVGSIGGTLYHAFRNSRFFLLMDWLPIVIIILCTIYYCLYHVLKKHYLVLPVFLLLAALQYAGRFVGSGSHNMNVSLRYIGMAVSLLLPLFLYMRANHFREAKWVLMALFSFILAIGFRMGDLFEWLPMGTHFLWHIFGAIATHSMFWYLYEVRRPLFMKQD